MGLADYNARYYDVALGRFISPDSIIPEQTQGNLAWDRYAYVNANPILKNDPSGHCVGPLAAICAVVLAVSVVGVMTSYLGGDSPRPELINNPQASQQAIEQANQQALLFANIGLFTVSALSLGESLYSDVKTTSGMVSGGGKSPSVKPVDSTSLLSDNSAPDFIGASSGELIPVPSGSSGPGPVASGKGFRYDGGSGGKGLHPDASGVRIMDSTSPKPPSPGYPNGYVSYNNKAGQTINPYSGQTVPKNSPWWHIRLGK